MFSLFHEPNNEEYMYRSIKVILANIEFEFVWQKFEASLQGYIHGPHITSVKLNEICLYFPLFPLSFQHDEQHVCR